MKMKTNKGFTLIELLIVIAIIGILATALLPTILNAPGKARDSARTLGISSVITGIESYNADNGKYPPATSNGCIDGSHPFNGVAGDYFSGGNLPQDPSGARTSLTGSDAVTACAKAGQYYYKYLGDANGQYIVAAVMELQKNNNSDNLDGDAPTCTDDCDYFVQIQ